MAGHSKWKNIRAHKGAQDAKKGKIFAKIATEITVAVRQSGGEADTNPRLRGALLKARAKGMPNDNIERAIKKGLGDTDAAGYTEKTYEGYGPGGIAFVVECLTDNINRTVSDVRHCFTKFGGSLGTEGSVGWQFHKQGLFVFERAKVADREGLLELAIESGAEDVKEEDDAIAVSCSVQKFLTLKDILDAKGFEAELAELTRVPETYTSVDVANADTVRQMVDWLEDLDDVQNVFHNADLAG